MSPRDERLDGSMSADEIASREARLTPHRERAIRAFGEVVFARLRALATDAWSLGRQRGHGRVTDEHEAGALRAADRLEEAREVARSMSAKPTPWWAAGTPRSEVWQRVNVLVEEALALVADHLREATSRRLAAQELVNAIDADAAPAPGRPSDRSWFVRTALKRFPATRKIAPGDWAHFGLAVRLDSELEDFEELRKSYADLLRLSPGKSRRRR